MKLRQINLYWVKSPLTVPYKVSYRTFDEFEPIMVEALDEDGRVGWGEGHISPGSSAETRDGGWAFACEQAGKIVGMEAAAAIAHVDGNKKSNKVAATALVTAIEMLQGDPILKLDRDVRLPLLTPFNAFDLAGVPAEVERRLEQGFRTLKIKVGKNVDEDLARVAAIQKANKGRARLRLDANRGFTPADGCRFASSLDPDSIMLFEQPCATDDWDGNGAVAKVSTVPLMLDEPIYYKEDIERAAKIKNVGFVKMKLKRTGSLSRLKSCLELAKKLGLEPVLGDGTSLDINCWMEACVARSTIDNAGEYNGFLKAKKSLLENPMSFEKGEMILPAGYVPVVDRKILAAYTVKSERYAAASSAVRAAE
jgi:L-alanine-DL-glutamate epimerase-like enolase superfamily enzyme